MNWEATKEEKLVSHQFTLSHFSFIICESIFTFLANLPLNNCYFLLLI